MKKLLISMLVLLLASGAYAELKEHWRLDETSGGRAYNSAGYHDGLLQLQAGPYGGGIWQPTEGFDGALELQSDERVIMPSIDMSGSWTVMGWIKPTTLEPWGRFIVSDHVNGFYLGLNDTNNWTFIVDLSSGTGNLLTGAAPSADTWQHVAGVYDASFSQMTLYVNGVAAGGSPLTSSAPSVPNQAIFIGSDFRYGSPSLTGMYDDCAIYNEALTGAEVFAIANASQSLNNWQANIVSPADNAIDQAESLSLNWTTGSGAPGSIANHIVYYGTDPDDVFGSDETTQLGDTAVVTLPVGTTSYSPAGLARDMTVFWRVDEKINASTQARGAIWTFSTSSSVDIIIQPQNQRAGDGVGDSVNFSVDAISASGPMSYQWYKGGSPVGLNDPNLIITNVVAADAGEYNVVITNDVGSKTSDTALLMIKGLLGHWPLDGNADDISGYANNGTALNDPNYVAGISGQAVILNAETGAAGWHAIEIPNEAHFDIYDEFTASFWMNADYAIQDQWACMLSKGGNNGGWSVNKFWVFDFVSGHTDLNPDLSNADNLSFTAYEVSVFDSEWHLVTFVYDGSNESIYIDGEVEQSGPAAQTVANDIPLVIGAARTGATGGTEAAWFKGLIDDVRIYNYARSSTEIAQMYYDVTGTTACANKPIGDTDGNCVVDLSDFATLASEWLDCNLVPSSQCP